MIATAADDGAVLYWNDAAARLFGHSAADVLGRLLTDLIVPPNGAAEAMRLEEQAAMEGLVVCESLRLRRDGALVHVALSLKHVERSGERPAHYVHCLKDVTRLKTARDAKLVEAKYRDLLEYTPDAMLIVNATGQIVLVNSQAERVFGHSRQAMVGQPLEMLLPMRHRQAHLGLRSGFFAQPRARSMGASQQLFGLRKGGEEFPVEISLGPLQTEEGTMVMSAVRDVTERKRTEQTLQRALGEKEVLLKEIHHRVKNNMQVISSLLQLQSNCVSDPAMQSIFEECQNRIKSMALIHEKLYQTSDFTQVDFADYAHSLMSMLGRSLGAYARRSRVQLRTATVLLDIDRAIPAGLILNELVSNCFKHAFPDDRDGVIGIDIAAHGECSGGGPAPLSLTPERLKALNSEIQQRVQQRVEQLEESNRSLNAFCLSVTHDLRSPLFALTGLSDLLASRYATALDGEGRDFLAMIQRKSTQMNGLIDDYLRLARLRQAPLKHDDVDSEALVRDVALELAARYPAAATMTISPLPRVVADAGLMRQVWVNLLENALKFSSRSAAPQVEVAGEVSGQAACFRVRDNGAGFDPALTGRLFTMFQRLHTEAEFAGTGIGLATVAAVVQRHGGTIRAEGALGRGASFHFTLPLAQPAAVAGV